MSKKQARTTKWNYPLMRYLSLLLAVTLLFTGVAFARFALYRDTGMGAGIAKFDVSYTIDGVNSLTFGNQSYWQTLAGGWYAQGGSRTVRVGMYNNSDVDAHAHTLTMEGPAEFWENIALQLTTVKEESESETGYEESESETGYAAGEIVTTQYVLADFLRVRSGGETADGSTSDERHNYKYDAYIDWKTQKDANDATDGKFDTKFSDEFGQRGSIEETFLMSGGIEATGKVTAVRQLARDTATDSASSVFAEQDLTITITASKREVQYSVGYVRKEGNTSLPAFYLDCKKEVPYYTIEITLPDNYTESGNPDDPYFVLGAKPADGSTGEADSVLVFLTWTNSVSSEDLSSDPDIALTPDDLVDVATKSGGTFNGAQVIGYHFNYNDVPAMQNGQSIETTVRMNKTIGETDIRWEHIASISSGEGAYPHPLNKQENGNYRCDGENYVEIAAGDLGSGKYDGSFDRSEFETTKLGESQGEMQNDYCVAAEKGYAVRFAVYFEQHSELPEQAGA